MKRVIVNVLAVFGVIFVCLLVASAYVFIADPFNLKQIFYPMAMPSLEKNSLENKQEPAFDEEPLKEANESGAVAPAPARILFNLSAAQRQALINLGVSPDSIPTSLSYEQEQCFVGVLGEARVDEIKAGAIPGPLEFMRAKACI